MHEEQLSDTQDDSGGSTQHQPNNELNLSDEDGDVGEIEVRIEEQLSEILGPNPEQLRNVAAKIATIVRSESYSGPLPHPKHIEHFERVLPGSAERILSMAERHHEHNISMEKSSFEASKIDERRGMIWGGALFAFLILCAFIVAVLDESATKPAVFLGAAVIGGIALFVNGRSK